MNKEKLKVELLELRVEWGHLIEAHTELKNHIIYAKSNHSILMENLRQQEKQYAAEIKRVTTAIKAIEKQLNSIN